MHSEWVASLQNQSKDVVQDTLLTVVGTPTDQWSDIVTKTSDARLQKVRGQLEKSTGIGVGAAMIKIMGRCTALGEALEAAAIFALETDLRGNMGVGGVYNAYGDAGFRHPKAISLSITAALRLQKWDVSLRLIDLGVPLDRRSVLEVLVDDEVAHKPSELFTVLVRRESNKELVCKLMYLMGCGEGEYGRGPGGKVDPNVRLNETEEQDKKVVDDFASRMTERRYASLGMTKLDSTTNLS